MDKKHYITHAEAVLQFTVYGEVWYELDDVEGVYATALGEGFGDTIADVTDDRRYFIFNNTIKFMPFEHKGKTYKMREVQGDELTYKVVEYALWEALKQGDEDFSVTDDEFAYYADDEEILLSDDELLAIIYCENNPITASVDVPQKEPMLIFGMIEFGTMTIHGNTTEIAVVQSIHKCYNSVALGYLNKQTLIDENDGFDYVDTKEYQGKVVFSDEAFHDSLLSYGVNEKSKTISVSWDLSEIQEYFEDEKIPDDAMWLLMQREFHKTGTIEIENMKDRVWDYREKHPKTE